MARCYCRSTGEPCGWCMSCTSKLCNATHLCWNSYCPANHDGVSTKAGQTLIGSLGRAKGLRAALSCCQVWNCCSRCSFCLRPRGCCDSISSFTFASAGVLAGSKSGSLVLGIAAEANSSISRHTHSCSCKARSNLYVESNLPKRCVCLRSKRLCQHQRKYDLDLSWHCVVLMWNLLQEDMCIEQHLHRQTNITFKST